MTVLREVTEALRQGENVERLLQSAKAKLEAGAGIPSTQPWCLPVGDENHPSRKWYAYTQHDLTGRRNAHINYYKHTGIDLNGDWRNPETGEFRGNVDIGEPVFAVADGVVVDAGFSNIYRGGVVIRVDHYGVPLFVRYWHIRDTETERGYSWLDIGDMVYGGKRLGEIDKYPNGYAHLHFDMAWQPLKVHWWFTKHPEVEWANPAWILRTHCDPAEVDAMMTKNN